MKENRKERLILSVSIAVFLLSLIMLISIGNNPKTTYLATELPSILKETQETKSVTDDVAGHLTYGPYMECRSGNYKIEVYYSSTDDGNYVDVCAELGTVVYAKYDLSEQEEFLSFEVTLEQDVSQLEIRTYYAGIGSMSVDRIVVQKVNKNFEKLRHLLIIIVAVSFLISLLFTKKLYSKKKGTVERSYPIEKVFDVGKIKSGVFSALFLSIIFCVVGPIDLYVSNSSEFWFSFVQILPIIVVTFFICFVLAIALPFLLNEKAFYYIIALEIGVASGLYIQGNYLNNDFGVLDGRTIEWSQYFERGLLSTLVWGICILLPLVLVFLLTQENVHKMFRWWSTIGSAIGVLVAALMIMTAQNLNGNTDFFFSKEGMFQVSDEENIVVFLLDTYDQSFLTETLEQYPEYQEKFKDFTRFTDVVGGGAPTHFGVPALMTGQLCYDNNFYEEYKQEAYSSALIYNDLEEHGFDMRVYSNAEYFSNELVDEEFDNVKRETMQINSYTGMAKTTYKLVLFKYMPQALKQYFWLSSDEFTQYAQSEEHENYVINDVQFYQDMKANGLDLISDSKVFRFYHLFGVHGPYTISENIERVEEGSRMQSCRASLNIVCEYMEMLKNAGAYDNTTILVMADHGAIAFSNVYESPMLMIKKKNTQQDAMGINIAPVTFQEVMPTLASCFLDKNEMREYGNTLFDIPETMKRTRIHVADNTLTRQYSGETNPSGLGVYEIDGFSGDAEAIHYMGDGLEYYNTNLKQNGD